MNYKFGFVFALLASTVLSTNAYTLNTNSETILSTYNELQDALTDSDALVTLDRNKQGIDLQGNKGIEITTNQEVTFKNIDSWINTSNNITNFGTISIDNVVFKDNETATNNIYVVGIVYNYSGNIKEIINSKFDNNKVSTGNVNLWGGIIENSGGGVIDLIKDTSFSNNTLYSGVNAPHGGVIHNGKQYSEVIGGTIKLIDNVVFENNIMTGKTDNTGGAHGVAIDNNGYGVIEKITNSKFINNRVYRTGTETKDPSVNYHASAGALDNYNIIKEISNSIFQGNSAEVESASAVASAAGTAGITGVSTVGVSTFGTSTDAVFLSIIATESNDKAKIVTAAPQVNFSRKSAV